MIRLALFLLSAVVAAVIFAYSIELPKPKPVDPTSMVKVEVVAPREPVPEPGTVMDVGVLETGYVHRGGYARQMPPQAPPASVYERPVPRAAPVVREAPAAPQSDPLHYRRYVRETVRQETPRVYRPQPDRPRIQQVDPDPYRDRPRTYYYAPPPPREEPRREGCNAMASWCADRPSYYQNRESGNNGRFSRAPNETRDRLPENRGEDFFE